jgi:hypothetical protein
LATNNRKTSAVRMLEQAVRRSICAAEFRMSGMATGRLETDLRKYVALLKRLAQDDPSEEFWEILQKAILKLVKYLRRVSC